VAIYACFELIIKPIFPYYVRAKKPPKWQPILAFIGFVISVGWIYLIANEIVSLLKAVGIEFGISDAILGLTVLAWGTSIGDMVADIAIAKQGYPRMGFSACFG
jgi:sodium/potassium/calcium exchanger 6